MIKLISALPLQRGLQDQEPRGKETVATARYGRDHNAPLRFVYFYIYDSSGEKSQR